MSSDVALVGTQIRYEQKSYWRNPLAAVFSFVVPMILFFVLVAAAGGGHDAKDLGANVLLKQYYTPSVLAFGVTSACFLNLTLTLTRQREAGILKRMRGTPLPAWALVGGIVGSSVIVAALISTVTVLFGVLVYNVHLPAAHVLPLIVTIVLAAAVFCSLGIAISSFIPNADSAPALVNFPYFILVAMSGTYFPVTGWLAKVTGYLPLRPFISGMYKVFNPYTFGHSGWPWHNLGSLAIWGAIGVFVAIRRFKWTPNRAS
jgi:ABC-2 type transport system permease protein